MKKPITYHLLWLCLAAVTLCSCGKSLNKRVTLWRNDKIPYGTYYAYENLQHLFRNSDITVNNTSPVNFYGDNYSSAYIIISPVVQPSERELKAILRHAINGNHVFISAFHIGQNLLDTFKLKAVPSKGYFDDSLSLSIVDRKGPYNLTYGYPGSRLDYHFTNMDSTVTYILGRDEAGNANFVRFNYQGGGSVMLHLAPIAFSNFFLLHKNNKSYYDIAVSSLPDTVSQVMWDDYFRHHINGEDNASRSAFSKLGAFLQNEVLRWVFWLTVLLFAIIFIFESKRKQRMVPVVKKPDNSSLDFVKTVGRLYFQRKDNKNLAAKITTHLLGHIRTRYNMQTSQLDHQFKEKLAYKSGHSLQFVNTLVDEIANIETASQLSDEQLMAYSDKIDTFINKG